MHVEAVREGDRRTVPDIGSNFVAIDVGLQLVRRRHHHQVSPFRHVGDRHDLEPVGLDLLGGRRAGLEADGDLLDTGLLQVERMRPALRSVADDGHLLALDEIEIGVAIVIDTHLRFLPGWFVRANGLSGGLLQPRKE
jgi:hypothetical protein